MAQELVPYIVAQYLDVDGGQWGDTDQTLFVSSDTVSALLATGGGAQSGVYYEPNVGAAILQPTLRWQHFGLAETTRSGTGALWRDNVDPRTNRRVLTQYSAAADIAWSAESSSQVIDGDNFGFAVSLYFAAAPLDTTDRDSSGIYRRVTWASDSAAGENRWRVTIPYQETPYLERSTDAGATWAREKTLNPTVDLRTPGEVRAVLSVMVIGTDMIVALGREFGAGGDVVSKNATYKTGKVLVSGKGGLTTIGFARIRNAKSGTFDSYEKPGPADMATPAANVYPCGSLAADMDAASQTLTGAILATYPLSFRFIYRVTLTAPAAAGDTDYADTTPYCRYVTVVYDPIYSAPAAGPWYDLDIVEYAQKIEFDPRNRVLRRSCRLTARITYDEMHPPMGVQAVRIYLGYLHEADASAYGLDPGVLQGYFVVRPVETYTSQGGDAFVVWEGTDPYWFLEPQSLPFFCNVSRWCAVSAARMLYQAGGVVPDLLAQLPKNTNGVDFCDFGPDPQNSAGTGLCPHAKMPTHAGWQPLTGIPGALAEVADVGWYWHGVEADGFLTLEPFDPDSYGPTVAKAFTEAGSAGGANYDAIGSITTDMMGMVYAPILERVRSVDGVKNDIMLIGVDTDTGIPIAARRRDELSIHNRTAFNYTGGRRPFFQANSLLIDQEYLENAIDKIFDYARNPYEGVMIPAMGQPWIFPSVELGAVVTAREVRTLGPWPVAYFLTAVETRFTAPGTLVSFLTGYWTGNGSPPGIAPGPPPEAERSAHDKGDGHKTFTEVNGESGRVDIIVEIHA